VTVEKMHACPLALGGAQRLSFVSGQNPQRLFHILQTTVGSSVTCRFMLTQNIINPLSTYHSIDFFSLSFTDYIVLFYSEDKSNCAPEKNELESKALSGDAICVDDILLFHNP
jgi:hypothetical protein